MHSINISSLCTSKGQTCCPVLSQLQFSYVLFLWHLTTRLNSSQGATKLGSVGPALLIVLLRRQSIALLWTILATTVLICFDHDSLQSRVTPSSLVSTCSISTLFYYKIQLRFSGLVNDMSQIQCFQIQLYLGLTDSLPPTPTVTAALCWMLQSFQSLQQLLCVVLSHPHTQTHWLTQSGMSLVKIE